MYVTAFDEHKADCQEAVDTILTPEFLAGIRKRLRNELDTLADNAVDAIVEEAGERVSHVAAERARKFLEAVLAGDPKAADNLFGLSGFDGRKGDRPVIHGRIFEAEPIKLRRQLVEANAELLKNARIADLEALLEAARRQVVALEGDLESRRRSYYES